MTSYETNSKEQQTEIPETTSISVVTPVQLSKEELSIRTSVIDDREPSRDGSEESEYVPYVCHCCMQKCQAEERDFRPSQSDEEDPPILYNTQSIGPDSQEVEVKILQPKCQCANCPLKNLCKSLYQANHVGRTLSKCF